LGIFIRVMATKEKAPKTSDFAIFQTGGKQYLVSEGDTIKIEKIIGDHKVGDSISFDDVLLVESGSDTTIGVPFIKGAKVSAEIKKIDRAKKVTVIKYKAKSNYFKKRGHRQPFFEVKISSIK
jgi:large subunit ribosomal protein L21